MSVERSVFESEDAEGRVLDVRACSGGARITLAIIREGEKADTMISFWLTKQEANHLSGFLEGICPE